MCLMDIQDELGIQLLSGAGSDSQVGEWSASLSTLLNLDLIVDGLNISFPINQLI